MRVIVEKIRELCENKNTSLAQLEKELDFGNGTIRRWNENLPSVDKVIKVANYFGVTVDFLTGMDNGGRA